MRSRRKPVLCLVVVGGLAGGAIGIVKLRAARRVTVLGADSHDFGHQTDAIRALTHKFVLRNDTGRPLAIARVAKSCTCLVAEPSNEPVPPGATWELDLSMQGQGIIGQKLARATVMFDDPEVKPVTLSVVADFLPQYTVNIRPTRFVLNGADPTLVREVSVTEFLIADQTGQDPPAIRVSEPERVQMSMRTLGGIVERGGRLVRQSVFSLCYHPHTADGLTETVMVEFIQSGLGFPVYLVFERRPDATTATE